jgi:thymidylate synthase (FAD)
MKVLLRAYTQPHESPGLEDIQELIAYCARVSNPSNQINNETSEKLLKYLIKHKHWSPLEMASATMEIETTRDIARQLLRHRSFSFQEFSQRYANVDEFGDNMFELCEARLQDTKNRQNSIETNDADLQSAWNIMQQETIDKAEEAYLWAIGNGIAKEQARKVLPEGLTMSRLYVNGTLRSWIHYIELRSGNGTQKEHMNLAIACGEAISKIFPLAKDIMQGE